MAKFVKHTSCEKCGSSDAKALYDDGSSWCFSCHNWSNGNSYSRYENSRKNVSEEHRKLPDDFSSHILGPGVEWVSRYGLDPEDLLVHDVGYSARYNQVIFTFPPTKLWQARNLNSTSKVKYFTSGNHEAILPIYRCGKEVDVCVITEDCLSAIKIASGGKKAGIWLDAMPLLGSALSVSKTLALSRYYKTLIFWLDHDKGRNAQRFARHASLIGMETKVIHTELDPKEYNYDELRKKLL